MTRRGRNDSGHISATDRRRLEAATGTAVAFDRSVFSPDSLTWRVHRESALLFGGGRALLMQVAHPLVAAGVAAHSHFRTAPLQRLWRTLDLMLTITFAPASDALGAVHAIERVHARVCGRLPAAIGPFRRGTRYAADDPELLLWVHATLVDSALLAYERFVDPLQPAERAEYYEQSKIIGRLLGIPDRLLPPTLLEFRRYVERMIRSDALTVGAAGRDIAAAVMHPRRPVGLKEALVIPNFVTVGLLPPQLRRRFGFPWGTWQEQGAQWFASAIRHLVPVLPTIVRQLPHARAAVAGTAPRSFKDHLAKMPDVGADVLFERVPARMRRVRL